MVKKTAGLGPEGRKHSNPRKTLSPTTTISVVKTNLRFVPQHDSTVQKYSLFYKSQPLCSEPVTNINGIDGRNAVILQKTCISRTRLYHFFQVHFKVNHCKTLVICISIHNVAQCQKELDFIANLESLNIYILFRAIHGTWVGITLLFAKTFTCK